MMIDDYEWDLVFKRNGYSMNLIEKQFRLGNTQAVKECYKHDRLRFMYDELRNLEFKYYEISSTREAADVQYAQADIYSSLLDEYLEDSEFLLVWMIKNQVNYRFIKLSDKIDRSILRTLSEMDCGHLSADAKEILGLDNRSIFSAQNKLRKTKLTQPCCLTCINYYDKNCNQFQEYIGYHIGKVEYDNLCDLWELDND